MCSFIIKNSDLYENKYTIDILEYNIDNLHLRTLLLTQKLNAEFCVKYILDPNEEYIKDINDEDIYLNEILFYQPHIKEADIYKLFINTNTS